MPPTGIPSPPPSSWPSGRRDRLSADPEALFAYGTLRFPEVLRALLRRVPGRSPAAAAGWRVVCLARRAYPALVPGHGVASGCLITDLTVEEWTLLDAFEDDVYRLQRVPLVDGRQGWAYVCEGTAQTTAESWSAERFAARHLAAYVANCLAWRRRYGDGGAGRRPCPPP